MQINNVNSNISFGKTPVMICEVKKKKETDRRTATLYKMDIKKHEDLNEIKYSKTARTLYPDAEKDRHYMSPGREYYLLKDDSTNEVISCASITTHIRQGEGKTSGFSFVIDGFSER